MKSIMKSSRNLSTRIYLKGLWTVFCFWDICHTLVRHPIWLTRCYKNSSWVGIEFQDNTRGDVSGNGQSWALKICRIKQVLETSYEHQQFTSLQFTCSLHNIHTCFERCFFLILWCFSCFFRIIPSAPRHRAMTVQLLCVWDVWRLPMSLPYFSRAFVSTLPKDRVVRVVELKKVIWSKLICHLCWFSLFLTAWTWNIRYEIWNVLSWVFVCFIDWWVEFWIITCQNRYCK